MNHAPRTLLLLAALLAAVPALHAQGRKTTRAITPADLRTRLERIAHDSMLGREPGGIGNFRTTEYIAAEFKRLGLEPAGEHGTWFQTVPFVRVQPDSAMRVSAGGTDLVAGTDYLLAGQPMALRRLEHVPSVFGGPLNDSTRWLPADSVAGRVVVLTLVPGRSGTRQANALGPYLGNPRFARATLIAVVALDVLGPERIAMAMAGRLTTDTTLRSGGMPILYVTPAAAEVMLGRLLGATAVGTAGKPIDATIGHARSATAWPARNVIAVLRGNDRKFRRAYVALTAHNDHVGFDHAPADHDSIRAFDRVVRPMGADSPNRPATAQEMLQVRTILDTLRKIRPARPDSIRNGADDDGSGTVSILEIAERMVAERKQLRRSI
ncbi:MAG: hypothetical protein H0U85_02225, partial [Gemmatimonadales bacterium]|nr:hypothetical protein [Gemmatimonadales bacterium]